MQDAHLHLQDPRLQDIDTIISEMIAAGVSQCVVNGTSPDDWERVKQLANTHPNLIIPSYGLHPWKTPYADDWKPLLREYLTNAPIPCIGECGLDRWIKNFDPEAQQDTFLYQLDLASEMNAPLSIHILHAWGWFMDILKKHKSTKTEKSKHFPARGFLLHSYNGSIELVSELLEAGAYFSFSGYSLQPRKKSQLNVLSEIPIDRLLIETDAPDMLPPDTCISHPLITLNSQNRVTSINHPANLSSIYSQLANHLNIDHLRLKTQVSKNFSRFFLAK